MKKTAASILILILSSFFSIASLLYHKEFAGRAELDYRHHLNWAYQVGTDIREGIPYPRWLSESNNGYGSPTMIFYSPLFYLLTGLVNLYNPSMVVSLKFVIFSGFFLAGMFMYIFLRDFCNHAASVAGGIAFQLLPYNMINLWRGALAETFAIFWLPLIMYFVHRGFKKNKIHQWIGLSFSYAGLIITHLVSAYIFTFIIVLYTLYLSAKERSYMLLLRSASAMIFGLSMAAIFFLPMLYERRFVHIEWITEVGWGNYRKNFLFMAGDSFNKNLELITILLVFLVVNSLLLTLYQKRKYGRPPDTQYVFFSGAFLFSIFMSTYFSLPVWSLVPGLSTIQSPWRWLTVATLATSVLIGFTLETFSSLMKTDRFIRISMAMFHAFIIANLYLSSTYIITAEPMKRSDLEWILKNGGDVIEYRPIWLFEKTKDFSKEKRTYVTFKEGDGSIDIANWESHYRLFIVNTESPSTVRISTFYYPGWTVLMDGMQMPIDIEKNSGAMLLRLPRGSHKVLLEFRDTPLRRTAEWISTISLIIAFAGLTVTRLKKGVVKKVLFF